MTMKSQAHGFSYHLCTNYTSTLHYWFRPEKFLRQDANPEDLQMQRNAAATRHSLPPLHPVLFCSVLFRSVPLPSSLLLPRLITSPTHHTLSISTDVFINPAIQPSSVSLHGLTGQIYNCHSQGSRATGSTADLQAEALLRRQKEKPDHPKPPIPPHTQHIQASQHPSSRSLTHGLFCLL